MGENDNSQNRLVFGLKYWFSIIFVAFFGGLFLRLVRPFYHAYKIQNWLNSESGYVHDYNRNLELYGDFKFEVQLGGPEGPELEIENVFLEAPVQITAVKKFDPAVLIYLTDEPEGDDVLRSSNQDRRNFVMMMETVLTTLPGNFAYRNQEGEVVPFEQSDEVVLEYRLYPDGLSQHALINGIISMVNGLRYITRREEALEEEITESR